MSKTLLDAGYYKISSEPMTVPSEGAAEFSAATDTAYLIECAKGVPATELVEYLGAENAWPCFDRNNAAKAYVLVRPKQDAQLNAECIAAATKLSFTPHPEAYESLRYGLEKHGSQADGVGLLVQDVGISSALTQHLDKLLPESYTALLEAHPKLMPPLMISERQSRNNGSERVKRTLKKIDNNYNAEEMYKATGMYLVTNTDTQHMALAFADPKLRDLDKPIIAGMPSLAMLYRGAEGTVPACSVFIAGKYDECARKGYDHIISIYNSVEDPDITVKHYGSMAVKGWLDRCAPTPQSPIKVSYETHNTVKGDDWNWEHRPTDFANDRAASICDYATFQHWLTMHEGNHIGPATKCNLVRSNEQQAL